MGREGGGVSLYSSLVYKESLEWDFKYRGPVPQKILFKGQKNKYFNLISRRSQWYSLCVYMYIGIFLLDLLINVTFWRLNTKTMWGLLEYIVLTTLSLSYIHIKQLQTCRVIDQICWTISCLYNLRERERERERGGTDWLCSILTGSL